MGSTTVIWFTGKLETISTLSLWTISISSMRTPHSYGLPCWVSSANTMPSLISIGWSSDQMREITGWSYCASPKPWPHRLAAA